MAPSTITQLYVRRLQMLIFQFLVVIFLVFLLFMQPDALTMFMKTRRPTSSSSTLATITNGHGDTRVVIQEPPPQRANATLMMLARNSDLEGAIHSILSVESKFNHAYNYPWVFLNEVPFTDEFKAGVLNATNASVQFGLVPHDHWFQPEWINETRAAEGRLRMAEHDVLYADSVSYRNMCRFNSGFFHNHELLQPYKWYWRVEPDVTFYCEINFDPFQYMEDHNKTYSFTIALREFEYSVESIWTAVKNFSATYPHYISRDNAMGFVTNDGDSYNLCHFWSNFEIADMDFYRSEAYSTFFKHLDATGNFYYERWGDAPVHSIAASLLLPKDRLHFFEEIGYKHSVLTHCPQGRKHKIGKCECDPHDNWDYKRHSCLRKYHAMTSFNHWALELLYG